MNIKDIKALAKLMNEYDLSSIEWKEEQSAIVLKKDIAKNVSAFKIPNINKRMDMQHIAGNVSTDISITEEREDFNDIIEVTSPFVGVFYSSASTDNLPFVSIDSQVKKGDVLCIVESMKIMNEILSEQEGKVIDICVKNGEIVEFGQVLYKLI